MSREKKGSKRRSEPEVAAILKLRDKLLASAEEKDKEAIHMACKGLFFCSKTKDPKCFKSIEEKLLALQGGSPKKKSASGGGRARSRSRSRSKPRRKKSRSRSKKRR